MTPPEDGELPAATRSEPVGVQPPLGNPGRPGDDPSAVAAARARRRARARKEWAIIIVVTILGTFLVRSFVMQSYRIPSDSMETTLHGCTGCNDDRILVNKLSYKLHGVHRGDVVVFKTTGIWLQNLGHEDVVKRVIGLPGDTVRCCDTQGRVVVNGKSIDEPYVYVDPRGVGAKHEFPTADDAALPWVSTVDGQLSVVVPQGELWVMGDHRNDSEDSRYNGPVPKSSVIGRAFMRMWPLSRIGGL